MRIFLLLVIVPISLSVAASEWVYSKNVDDFTDTDTQLAMVKAQKSWGIVRCKNGSHFELLFSVDKFIGLQGSVRIRYRIDKQEPRIQMWSVSTKGTAVFVNNEANKKELARGMQNGNSLLLEVTDFMGTPHKERFSLKGARVAIGKVMNACNVNRNKYDLDGVEEAVFRHVDLYGPKNIECKKDMLKWLDYDIADHSSKKSPDLYLALQKYMDDKFVKCGSGDVSRSEKNYECKSKDRYLNGLYGEATKYNNSIKVKCGHLKINE